MTVLYNNVHVLLQIKKVLENSVFAEKQFTSFPPSLSMVNLVFALLEKNIIALTAL